MGVDSLFIQLPKRILMGEESMFRFRRKEKAAATPQVKEELAIDHDALVLTFTKTEQYPAQ